MTLDSGKGWTTTLSLIVLPVVARLSLGRTSTPRVVTVLPLLIIVHLHGWDGDRLLVQIVAVRVEDVKNLVVVLVVEAPNQLLQGGIKIGHGLHIHIISVPSQEHPAAS